MTLRCGRSALEGRIAIRGQPTCMVLRKSKKCPSVTRRLARLLRSVVDHCVRVL